MKIIIEKVLVMLFVIVLLNACGGSSVVGDDNNSSLKKDGTDAEANKTSPNIPEKTLSACTITVKVGSSIQDAVDGAKSGDTICIESGIYREEVTIRAFKGPLTMRGLTPVNRDTPNSGGGAILSGKTLSSISNGVIDIFDSSYITISGLTIEDANNDNEEIGIDIENSQNILIEDNLIQRINSSGIGAWSKVGGRGNPIGGSANIILRNNTIIDVNDGGGNEKISVAGVDGFLVYGNDIYNINRAVDTSKGGEGIDIKQGSRNGKVYDNHIHDIDSTKGVKRPCLYVDAFNYDTYNIEVFNNIIYNCGATAIMVSDEVAGAGILENLLIYNNLIFDNDADIIAGSPDRNAIEISTTNEGSGVKSVKNIAVFNNTIHNSSGGIIVKDQSLSANGIANITIQNNIISGNTGGYNISTKNLQSFANENIEAVKVYKNLYEKDLTIVDIWGGGYHSYSGSQTDENGDIIDTSNQKILEINPLVNPTNRDYLAGDFKLKSGSLGVDYGSSKADIIATFSKFTYTKVENPSLHIDNNPSTFLSTDLTILGVVAKSFSSKLDKDLSGATRPQGNGVDIGAYQN
ncbi:MAG: right-handed parallel beta-helix repeat-containing protein [Sulfurovum sp.]